MRAFWTLAAATLVIGATACSDGGGKAAFDAAKAAVSAKLPGGAGSVEFGGMKLRHLTGLKGSKADVVCGGTVPKGAQGAPDPAPFIYIAKLQPAAPDPGRAQGDVILLTPQIDRQAAGLLTNFCEAKLTSALPNPYTYFN